MGTETAVDQAEMSEVDEMVSEALEIVDVESEAGETKEAVETAATEKEGEEISEETGKETPPAEDKPKAVTTTDDEKSGKDEKGESEEEASLEDIMSDGKDAKTDVEKSKDGTPDWLQKQLDKKTRQNKEAIEAKDKEITELKSRVIPEKRPPVPIESAFATTAEYQAEYQKWKDQDDDWKVANVNHEKQAKAASDRLEKNVKSFVTASERMSEKYDDFDRVVNKETHYGHLDTILLATEFPAEISYHLGKNPAKLEAIIALDSISAAIAIGELSGRCKASGVKEVTTAPKVLKKVEDTPGGGGSDEVSLKDIEKISGDYLNLA